MGDVGAVARLANTLASWLLSPNGYVRWSLKRQARSQAKELRDELAKQLASDSPDYRVFNTKLSAYRRLRRRTRGS